MPSNGEQEEVQVNEIFWDLRQAKRLPADELASLVRNLTSRFISRLEALHRVFDEGRLLALRHGEQYDEALIQTALVSLVIADINYLNPYVKAEQIANITNACHTLGISYREALEMTTREREVVAALGGNE
jgi:hypothetical protein